MTPLAMRNLFTGLATGFALVFIVASLFLHPSGGDDLQWLATLAAESALCSFVAIAWRWA
jgi:hypothetical protein